MNIIKNLMEDNVNNKAQEFKSTVDFIFNEFENIKNVISNWSGEGAITMSRTIENLKVELELMKKRKRKRISY